MADAGGNGENRMKAPRRSIARIVTACLLIAPLYTAHAVDQTTSSTTHHKSHKAAPPLVLPPMPRGPLRQIPMDQLPAEPPRVSYQNGLLSISAQNATLSEILNEVHKQTGAAIDLPPRVGNDRVVTQLGPGAPREVLAQLLNGTSFNYVMVGSLSDPNAVASVTLTVKQAIGGEVQTAANVPMFQPPQPATVMPAGRMGSQPFRPQILNAVGQPQPPGAANAAAADADDDDESADDKDDDDQAQPAQPGQPGQPGQAGISPAVPPTGPTVSSDDQSESSTPNSGPKTPEQILQMMRQGQPGAIPPGAQQPPQQ